MNHLAPLLLALRLFPALSAKVDGPFVESGRKAREETTPSTPIAPPSPSSPAAKTRGETRGAAAKTRGAGGVGPEGEQGGVGLGQHPPQGGVGWGQQPRVVWVSSGLHRWGEVTPEPTELDVEGGVCGLDAVAYRWAESLNRPES